MDEEFERKVGYSIKYTAALIVDWSVKTRVVVSASRFINTSATKYRLTIPLDAKTLFEKIVDTPK